MISCVGLGEYCRLSGQQALKNDGSFMLTVLCKNANHVQRSEAITLSIRSRSTSVPHLRLQLLEEVLDEYQLAAPANDRGDPINPFHEQPLEARYAYRGGSSCVG